MASGVGTSGGAAAAILVWESEKVGISTYFLHFYFYHYN